MRGIRRLAAYSVRGQGPELRRLAVWSIAGALPVFLTGRLVAQATDHGFLVHRPATGLAWLSLLGVGVVIGAWATQRVLRGLSAVVEPLRDRLVEDVVASALQTSTIPGAVPDTAAVGRLTQHVEIVRDAYAGVLGVVQMFLVTTVSALLGLVTLVPLALVFVVPPLLIGLGLFVAAIRPTATRQRASILADERIAESITTISTGLRDVSACGGEAVAERMVEQHVDAHAQATRELARLAAVRSLAIAVGGWLPLVLILVGSPWLVRHGASTGAILGALIYVLQGVHPALQTLARGLGTSGLWLIITLGRILSAVDATSKSRLSGDGDVGYVSALASHHVGTLELRSVTFRYGPGAVPVLSDLDLTVAPGDHFAVVGPSGAGKSTLAGVMAGVLRPESGRVRIGEVVVNDASTSDLPRHRVLIPQEAYIFDGTVWENLTYLCREATSATVDRSVARLGATGLIERLGGPDARMRASLLSAGERQLITLVRAYIAPARLVILDEATCHLDPAAEARVEKAFAERPGTLVVIAHRISSALRARRILVMDGAETDVGTHDELLVRSSLYRDLVGLWFAGEVSPSASPT